MIFIEFWDLGECWTNLSIRLGRKWPLSCCYYGFCLSAQGTFSSWSSISLTRRPVGQHNPKAVSSVQSIPPPIQVIEVTNYLASRRSLDAQSSQWSAFRSNLFDRKNQQSMILILASRRVIKRYIDHRAVFLQDTSATLPQHVAHALERAPFD